MNTTRMGFAMTGSFCTFESVFGQIQRLAERGYDITPILSYNGNQEENRFVVPREVQEKLHLITGKKPLCQLSQVEPIGPKKLLDIYVLAPATGNSLGKLAAGIYDTPALLGVKSHLRNERPVVVAISTNDGLAAAAQNIGKLMAQRNYYFVPFGQDDPYGKPRSLVAHFDLLPKTVAAALAGVQLQPMLREYVTHNGKKV